MATIDDTEAPGPSVEVRGVGVELGGATILDDVSISVGDAELVALVGPSGCGKTTLLRVVAGLQTAARGTVRLAGHDVTKVPTRDRRIGMVFQHYALFPTMTAQANVAFPLLAEGASKGEAASRAGRLLELVGMEGLHGRRPSELSGGQQQRVALARALARDPDVLLLDEPLSALDAVIRESLRDEIRRLQQELGLTVVHVTHDQAEAMAMADRVAMMFGGRIIEVGTPEQLYQQPADVLTARFIGGRNEVPITTEADGSLRWLEALRIDPSPAPVVGAMFPPEGLEVGPADGGGAPATVTLSSFQGSTIRLHLDAAGTAVVAELAAVDGRRFAPGTTCAIRVRPDTVTLVPADAPSTDPVASEEDR